MHRVVTNYTPVDTGGSNISVFVRARPVEDGSDPNELIQIDAEDNRKLSIRDPVGSDRRYGEVTFQFDKVFSSDTQQKDIFDKACKVHVDNVLQGYNSCIFAYGQTGSGKTYTMFGEDGEVQGVIPRAVEYLFQCLAKRTAANEVAMVCSFLEIYNDQIRDLGKAYLVAMGVESSSSTALYEKTSDIFENLAGKRGNPYFAPAFHRPGSAVASSAENRPGIKEVQDEYNTMNYEIREDNEGNVFVKDLSLVPVTTMEEVMSLIAMGLRVRATHETKMNAVSSRSHTVFTITVLQRDKISGQAVTAMLNLVDLAGSERLKKSESQGIRLKEALHINTSLTALGKVIMALDPSSETTHVPYRDSKLTRVLQNSLGGNSFTTVIAAVHPSMKYYEECLSTLQFANRCRNVRNNPKVNYVEDGEDKDRKIRKLTEELVVLRTKFSQTQGKGGFTSTAGAEGNLSVGRILSMLKVLGISATAGNESIVVNGKKFSLDELGLDGSASTTESAGGTGAQHGESVRGKEATGGPNVEKLQKTIKELKESSETYATRAKERKSQVEEQAREIQKLSAELVKCRTTIKHKEFEFTSLLEEKERSLTEMRAMLEIKHKEEIETILKSNNDLIREQQMENEKIPQALKEYTVMVHKLSKQKLAIETPLRTEFESHLKHVDKSRLDEIDKIKKQYEYWLDEKDKALSGFVEAFNAYRAKKAEQLTMAEREIVRLYDYTEQIETILDNVEKGKFQVKQKQGANGGRSTTGILGSAGGASGDGTLGAIVLPKGLRPINPLKLMPPGGSSGLELTKRIVDKHKERVTRLDQMKEEAFQKSLHYAAQSNATATGSVDDLLKQQVRDLLVQKSPSRNQRSSPNRGASSGTAPRSMSPKNSSIGLDDHHHNHSHIKSGHATAPGGLQGRHSPKARSVEDWHEPSHGQHLSEDLLRELHELREKVKNEHVTTQKVLNDLASNETFVYIQKLESETERLKKQLKEVTAQLQSSKVANASLSRTMEKTKKFETGIF